MGFGALCGALGGGGERGGMGLWCVRDVLARFPSCGHETSCTNKTCSCLSDQEVFLVEGLSAIGVSCFILV